MNAFASTWLALREPADRAARDPALLVSRCDPTRRRREPADRRSRLRHRVDAAHLSSELVPAASWRLVDNDPALLSEAKRRAARDAVETVEANLADVAAIPVAGARLVTASALFDLASRELVDGARRAARGSRGGALRRPQL